MIDRIRLRAFPLLAIGTQLLAGCNSRVEAPPPPPHCAPEPEEWPSESRSPRETIGASLHSVSAGFRMESKDVQERILRPVMRHCGLSNLEGMAISSWLDPHTRLESFTLIRRPPMTRRIHGCPNLADSAIYLETEFLGGPISCLDCQHIYSRNTPQPEDSAFCATYPFENRK